MCNVPQGKSSGTQMGELHISYTNSPCFYATRKVSAVFKKAGHRPVIYIVAYFLCCGLESWRILVSFLDVDFLIPGFHNHTSVSAWSMIRYSVFAHNSLIGTTWFVENHARIYHCITRALLLIRVTLFRDCVPRRPVSINRFIFSRGNIPCPLIIFWLKNVIDLMRIHLVLYH